MTIVEKHQLKDYIVLEEFNMPAEGVFVAASIVLVRKPDGEYVTWLRNDDTGSMGQGHYFSPYQYPNPGTALMAAAEDYALRVKRRS